MNSKRKVILFFIGILFLLIIGAVIFIKSAISAIDSNIYMTVEEKLILLFNYKESEKYGRLQKFDISLKYNRLADELPDIIKESPENMANSLSLGYACGLINDSECAVNYLSALKICRSNDWISNFLLSYYHFIRWEDEKSLDYIRKTRDLYEKESEKKNPDVFFSFIEEYETFLVNNIKSKKINEERGIVELASPKGCVFIDINPVKDGSVKWEGECVNGYAEGEGTLYYENGAEFKVIMKKGVMEGYADLKWKGGGRFKGKLVKGVPNGEGKQWEKGKLIYEGGFKKFSFHGKGRKYHSNKLFVGEFVEGIPLPQLKHKVICDFNTDSPYETHYSIIRNYPVKNHKYLLDVQCQGKDVSEKVLDKREKIHENRERLDVLKENPELAECWDEKDIKTLFSERL